jgi:sugar-specific transcriptional regulator TrmB
MIQTDLIRLGFTDKEAQVYMALIQYGASPASTLARRTNIKRTSMYDILNNLLEKNLVRTYKQGAHTYFVIDDIQKLAYQEKQRLNLAESLVKTLKDSQNLNQGIQVQHYKGIEGYREIYEDILRIKPKEMTGWIHLDEFLSAIDPKREEEWTKERISSGIYARLIMQNTALTQNFQSDDHKSNRETRFVPKGRPFKTSCLLYDNYIAFFDSNNDITGIRIHNPQLFQMQKAIFEMNWGCL